MKNKNRFSRVDLQVSILISVLSALTIICIYLFNYSYSYRDMLNTLEDQCRGIYVYVESIIKKDTFHAINDKQDNMTPTYLSLKYELEKARKITNVRYLYTAKKNDDGNFIYLVDGLDSSAEDFRNPGDIIEKEIWPDMEKALAGEIVFPKKILNTSWGNVFVSYFPIHNLDGEVEGVLGIEFDATHQYNTFRLLRMGTPIIGIFLWICSVVVSIFMFRKVSNPYFKDAINTDFLTHCKNRNAFETDINNIIHTQHQENYVLFSFDLNGLKQVNDSLGHLKGDEYIKIASRMIAEEMSEDVITYRSGGDEFAAWSKSLSFEEAQTLLKKLEDRFQKENSNGKYSYNLSISAGCAIFNYMTDRDLFDTFKRADMKMYEQKRKHYSDLSQLEKTL